MRCTTESRCDESKTVRGSSGELSRRMSLCTGDAGPGVWPRCRSPRAQLDARGTAAVSSGAQRSGDEATPSVAGGAVRRAQDGAQLRLGQGHYLSVAALEGADSVLAESENAAR